MNLSLLLTAAVCAADPAAPDAAIHRSLVRQTERLSERFMDGATTMAEWELKRSKLREQFLDMMGLWPLPEKTPLKSAVTGMLERGNVVIENVHFQSKPGLYVTGNYYRPKALPKDKKLPAILYVCGHSGRGRDGNKTAFQDHGMWFASNGYTCLIVDTLQLGEVAGKHHGTYNLNRFWWHSRGYTSAGVECWNGVRAIDYLITRPEVDADRIGVTGISGGGASTCWIAAADERVKVAVPVSGMSDLQSYVSNKIINGHCDCMFAINLYSWEWTTILALHAPKPVLFANSDMDPIFPMDGNRRIVERLRKGYEMLGAKEKVDEYVSKGGHDYRSDLRIAIYQYFNTHLLGDARKKVEDTQFEKIDGKELRVFREDKDLPKDSLNDRIDESFVAAAEVKLPAKKEDFAAWKAGLVTRLKEMPFRNNPAKLNSTFLEPTGRGMFITESDVLCELAPIRDGKGDEVVIVLNADEDAKEAGEFWAKRLPKDSSIVAIHTRGSGSNRWTRKNPPNTVERSMALLGRTVDSGRVYDVMSAVEKSKQLHLVGRREAGVIAAYAALLAPSGVTEVTIVDPPASHRDGPHFLGVQRILDVPEALGLLAPKVKLNLIDAKDKAFEKTAAIYKIAGGTLSLK